MLSLSKHVASNGVGASPFDGLRVRLGRWASGEVVPDIKHSPHPELVEG